MTEGALPPVPDRIKGGVKTWIRCGQAPKARGESSPTRSECRPGELPPRMRTRAPIRLRVMKSSLYAAFGEPAQRDPGPGTTRTSAVETIDDDHAYLELQQLTPAARSASRRDPGTRLTEAVETVDEDEVTMTLRELSAAAASTSDPRPGPGTTITKAVETTDEDALALVFFE